MRDNPEPTAQVDLLTGLSAVLSGEAALARAQEAAVGVSAPHGSKYLRHCEIDDQAQALAKKLGDRPVKS